MNVAYFRILELECDSCGRRIASVVLYDADDRVVESSGCVLFDDGPVCDECMYDDGDHPAAPVNVPQR